MLRKISAAFSIFTLLGIITVANVSAATLRPSLQAKLARLASDAKVGAVSIAFNTSNGLQPAYFDESRRRQPKSGRGARRGERLGG